MRDRERPEDVPEKKIPEDLEKNEGEGSPSAARRYKEALEEFKREHDVEELADEAAKELDDEDETPEKGAT